MHLIGITLTIVCATLIYLSHRQQIFLYSSLSTGFAWLGWGLGVLALGIMLISLSHIVAVFSFLITFILVWSFLPLLALLGKQPNHE